MVGAVFPSLPGITWPVKRRAVFSNQPQTSLTGKRTPVRFQTEPRWYYELPIEFARSGAGYTEFNDLLTVFQSCYGQYNTFLFNDITDNSVADHLIGTGDGVRTQFFLTRTLGGFAQRIAVLNGAATIRVNGVVAGGYSIDSNGILTFAGPPAAGATITWTGFYYWVCRFDEDQLDLAQFMSNFWEVPALKFSTEIITG